MHVRRNSLVDPLDWGGLPWRARRLRRHPEDRPAGIGRNPYRPAGKPAVGCANPDRYRNIAATGNPDSDKTGIGSHAGAETWSAAGTQQGEGP
ncbi:hypothetical protein LC55x_1694 [Lysobacter capsici]|nr:hypothetical protein LC55x_1694 [Lysobacter capsici]